MSTWLDLADIGEIRDKISLVFLKSVTLLILKGVCIYIYIFVCLPHSAKIERVYELAIPHSSKR